jgi:hypothetical protein
MPKAVNVPTPLAYCTVAEFVLNVKVKQKLKLPERGQSHHAGAEGSLGNSLKHPWFS